MTGNTKLLIVISLYSSARPELGLEPVLPPVILVPNNHIVWWIVVFLCVCYGQSSVTFKMFQSQMWSEYMRCTKYVMLSIWILYRVLCLVQCGRCNIELNLLQQWKAANANYEIFGEPLMTTGTHTNRISFHNASEQLSLCVCVMKNR